MFELESNNIGTQKVSYYKNLIPHVEEIKELYLGGMGLELIGNKFNTSRHIIRKILLKQNIEIKSRGSAEQRTVLNNPFLGETEEIFYWIGYLAADGSLAKGTNKINLISKDYEHLIKFNEFVRNPNKIANSGVNCFTTYFSNKEVFDYLVSIGITPNKADNFNLSIPVNKFIFRGYFDGDGSTWGADGCTMRFKITSSSLKWVKNCQSYLETEGFKSSIYRKDGTNFDSYDLTLIEYNVREFVNFLYKDAKIFLDRKREKCGRFLL